MRRTLVLLALLGLAGPAHAGTGCDAPRPRGPAGLAETIYVKGACGTLALRPDGRIEPVRPPNWAPSWAKAALARADAGTYIAHPRRHLVLLRAGRTFWRSRLAHGSDDVAVRGGAIAFTAYRRKHPNPDLWMANVGEPERLVARNEDLDGAARAGGFFTQRGRDLLLRAGDGRLIRRLALVTQTAYDGRTRTLVAITTSHQLVRTDGERSVVLADLARLRAPRPPWLELLSSGLIKVGSENRVLLLRPDGRTFASAGLPRDALIVSDFLPLPRGRGVVFAAQDSGVDRILLLERGRYVVRVLYDAQAVPTGCGYWANLSLAGQDVLYSPSTGRGLVAVDASGRTAPRDLWPLVHRIPGFRGHGRILRATWAPNWNR